MKHAITNLCSQSTNYRTMSLAILSHIADLRYEIVLSAINQRIEALAKNEWWENKCLAIIVFSKIIKGIILSEKF